MSILTYILDTIRGVFTIPLTQAQLDARLTELASKHTTQKKLNWHESIVDLMKLVGQDPSLQARCELAEELGYTGELNGSAEMNTWLHKQVMDKLAKQGGPLSK